MFFVGIDWADKKYDVTILDCNGKHCNPPFEIRKSITGFQNLDNKLKEISSNEKNFKIGIETPHNLLVDYLLGKNYPVYALHPSSMKSFRRRYRRTNARDDVYDSFVLADVARTDKECWHRVTQDSALYQQIRALVFDHEKLIKQRTMLKNSFQAQLKQYYPEYVDFFKDVSCKSSLMFFKAYPSFNEAAELSRDELGQFFKQYKFNNSSAHNKIYRILQQPHIKVPSHMITIKQVKALSGVELLFQTNKIVENYEQILSELVSKHPDSPIFLSFPGVAEVTAARLISLFGEDRELYESASIIQAKAGTSPVTEITGQDKKNKKGFRVIYFRRGCNKTYRSFVYNMAFVSLQRSEWAKLYYRKHRSKGHNHSHAIRCLANLQLKILFSMWKHKRLYDENRYLAQKTRHQMKNKFNDC
jgi:transposase